MSLSDNQVVILAANVTLPGIFAKDIAEGPILGSTPSHNSMMTIKLALRKLRLYCKAWAQLSAARTASRVHSLGKQEN